MHQQLLFVLIPQKASQAALKYACYKAKLLKFNIHILAVMESSYKNFLLRQRLWLMIREISLKNICRN